MIGLIEHDGGGARRKPAPRKAFQFLITLKDIKPAIWRRIQVPDTYSFWDLHVALTDCLGWLDYHLHVFRIVNPATGEKELIGIPDEDRYEEAPETYPGWDRKIARYFKPCTFAACEYEYDFGDGWAHEIRLEQVVPRQQGWKYPVCLGGDNACPPEDCGGPYGYQCFLESLRKGRRKSGGKVVDVRFLAFDPSHFDRDAVRFDNPNKRWHVAFGGKPLTPDMRAYEAFRRLNGKSE